MHATLKYRANAMIDAAPTPTSEYYAFTLRVGTEGKPEYACFGEWIGYTDSRPLREIRQASLVYPHKILNTWRRMNEPGMVVESLSDLCFLFLYGGHAVVEQGLAETVAPEWLKPHEVAHEGEYGFASPICLHKAAMQRAPTPRLRSRIIRRDNFRCRVCGRSPANHCDVELHVHHIRPWCVGGVTEEANLITLCHTCHNGLDPHFDRDLFQLLPKQAESAGRYARLLEQYQAVSLARTEVPCIVG